MDDLYDTLFGLSPRGKTLFAFLIGFALIDDLSADKQIAMGNLFVLIGQVLITDGAELRLVEIAKAEVEKQQLNNTISNFKDQIANIEAAFK